MNIDEAIERIEYNGEFFCNEFGETIKMVPAETVIEIVNQIDTRPKHVIVPRFVADWYEINKDDLNTAIYQAMIETDNRKSNDEVLDEFELWLIHNKNSLSTLIQMKLFSYEVEKEQLYVVAIPDGERGQVVQLWKTNTGKILFSFESEIRYGNLHKLTEQEIKQKDERLWQFAKPVNG